MGFLADEDEALLDEGWDSIVGGEEEEADGEDEEADAVSDALSVVFRVPEHGCHHESHNGQDENAGHEELGSSHDVYEVAAHQYPCLGKEGIGELWIKFPVCFHGDGTVGHVVVFLESVVAAVRSRRPL